MGTLLKTTKKTALALIGFLLLLAAPAALQAQGEFYAAPYYYDTNSDNTVFITGYNGPGGAVAIPTNINSLTVTDIAGDVFGGKTSLTSVTIPGSVNSIGEGAFYFCTSLTNTTICNGVTSLGGDMFISALI